MSSQMVNIGGYNISGTQLQQLQRAQASRARNVWVANPPAQPHFVADRDLFGKGEFDDYLAMMQDGIDYLNAVGRPSVW